MKRMNNGVKTIVKMMDNKCKVIVKTMGNKYPGGTREREWDKRMRMG